MENVLRFLLNHKIKAAQVLESPHGKQLSELLIHCLKNNHREINFCPVKPEK